jgi:hypothetical protein
VTLWTLVGVITAAGLSWLNSYYVQDYHSWKCWCCAFCYVFICMAYTSFSLYQVA